MLYSNNPEAYQAILEGCRRDNGQYLIDDRDVTRSSPTRQKPQHHLTMMAVAN